MLAPGADRPRLVVSEKEFMPIYEYRCLDCGWEGEYQQRMIEDPKTECESCKGRLERLISRSAFHLKGSGWYKDLYSSAKPKEGAAGSSADGGSSSGGETSSAGSGSESKPEGSKSEGSKKTEPAAATPSKNAAGSKAG